MGVYIKPCRGCPLRDGCEQKADFSKRVAGLGLRSVTFKCDLLAAEIRKGRRVVIHQPILGERGPWDDPYDVKIGRKEVSATVTYVDGAYRFSAIVDPGQMTEDESKDGGDLDKYRFRKRMFHGRLVRFLDEPDASFCQSGQLLRDGKCDMLGNECYCDQTAELLRTIAP